MTAMSDWEVKQMGIWRYRTPEGFDDMVIRSDGKYLTGLWFTGEALPAPAAQGELPEAVRLCVAWLDEYYARSNEPCVCIPAASQRELALGGPAAGMQTYGECRDSEGTRSVHEPVGMAENRGASQRELALPEIYIENLTPFRKEVLNIVKGIPFGQTMTYGEIARQIARERGISRMSAQAVGQAVGWNPVCLIIPCHRVIGADGSLTGYGGGVKNKKLLLAHEQGARIRLD